MPIDHALADTLPAMEEALMREINIIADNIPADRLAIQWDVTESILEVMIRYPTSRYPDFIGS